MQTIHGFRSTFYVVFYGAFYGVYYGAFYGAIITLYVGPSNREIAVSRGPRRTQFGLGKKKHGASAALDSLTAFGVPATGDHSHRWTLARGFDA